MEGKMSIKVTKPTKEELEKLGIDKWSSWGCGESVFDWEYSDNEDAYIFEGQVTVITPEGEVKFEAGDLVHFPKGLSCTWVVEKPVRKAYKFS